MLVRELMTREPLTVSGETGLGTARILMREARIRHLLVVDGGRLVGIMSDRDVRQALPSPATSLSVWELNYLVERLTVADVMTRTVMTINPERSAPDAARIMLDHKIGCLPVCDGTAIVGIITEADFVRAFAVMDEAAIMSGRPRE